MEIKDFLKLYDIPFLEIKKRYSEYFAQVFKNDKIWLGNVEDKVYLLKSNDAESQIMRVIGKLKGVDTFRKEDSPDLSAFIGKINKIINIVDRINNFKEGTVLEDGSRLKLYELFNELKLKHTLKEVDTTLNSNLRAFLPHLFSIVKHCQNPKQYPIYYKYWKNILWEVLKIKNDYDSFCQFYRTFPVQDRHLNFGAYLATIGDQIAINIKTYFPDIALDSKMYKSLIDKVLNLPRHIEMINATDFVSEDPKDKYKKLNVKQAFVSWFDQNDGKKSNYITKQFSGSIDRFSKELDKYEEIYLSDFKSELFILDPSNWNAEIENIKTNIYSRESQFSKFSIGDNNGRPKAILGKKNYLQFLTNYFNKEEETDQKKMKQATLNQILFGPPGTGKTYHSIDKALQIIDEEEEKKLDWTNREDVKKQFDKRLAEGRIVFTTFHQSMSYEDFIEGIKPVLDSEETDDATDEKEALKYEIKDGIFKSIANLATGVSGNIERTTEIDFGSKDFFKMSLGGKHRPEKHNWSIKNNLIFLGWGDDKDFTALKGIKDWKPFRDKFKQDYPELVAEKSKYVIQAVFIFQNMKVGDVVFITKGNNIIDAIGVITGDYFYDDSKEIDNYQFRKVKWLATDLNAAPDVFIRKKISQQTIYEFYNNDVKIEVLEDYFNSSDPGDAQEKKYVIIIDEINRGNVSQIFGELITLIEQDKRIGQDEALEITLPYSKQKFGVPDNLYIIGTMNTADRSVEALDTALRRRFSFEEMPPKYKLPELEYEVYGYSASDILKTINHRIEKLLDRDHAIGHSYFINKNEESIIDSFYKCILPLLQEYFFGDYGKIGLVLGRGFISKKEWDKSSYSFADFEYEGSGDFDEKEVFRIIDYRSDELTTILIDKKDITMDFGKAIQLLMKGSVNG